MDFFGLYDWFEQLPPNTLICTPNQRLVRFYREQYQQWIATKGEGTYPALECKALALWQSELWQNAQLLLPQHASRNVVLTPLQKKALWQNILADDDNLWAAGDVLEPALEADKLLKNWGLTPDNLAEQAHSAECELWLGWQQQYLAECENHGFMDAEDANNALLAAITTGELNALLPKHVVFTGFDQWPAPLARLEAALSAAGVQVRQQQVFANASEHAQRQSFNDAKSELFAAAQWAKKYSEQGQSVAVVVPDLGQRLAEVERVFQQVFAPSSVLPKTTFDAALYNVSSAAPLAQAPLVSAATQLLSWQGQSLPLAELKALLLNPFIGQHSELPALSQLLAQLASRYPKTSLLQLKAAVAETNQKAIGARTGTQSALSFLQIEAKEAGTKEAGTGTPYAGPLAQFYRCLEALQSSLGSSKASHKALPSVWAQQFAARLQAWNWPGTRTLNSLEFQQHSHWLLALAGLSEFDAVAGAVTYSRAQQLLAQVLKAPFHKQTPPAKVQILGVLEAAGPLFDGLWWLGLTSHAWPEPLKPNPLLPTALQREHKMPRANAQSELAYARAISQRLLRSASQVIVSHALFNGDEPLSPSPLIESIPLGSTSPLTPSDTVNTLHPWQYLPIAEAEYLHDEQAPALAVPVELKGGVSVIRRQAACPFQAFAVHRLGAASVEAMGEGLDHRDKGNLIHEVLERLWQQLETQERLLGIDDNELDSLIDDAIQTAITHLAQGRSLGKKLLALESVRVKRRIYTWLEQERARAPFSVSAHEKTLAFELAGLKLRLRMDRIDCLADGKTLAVIDYKTGQSNIKSWQWPRIDEPQIPLYATALPGVGAAVFAQVNTQEMKYIGLTSVPDVFDQLTNPSDHKDWQADFATVLNEWQHALHTIAAGFVQGDARVAPKTPKTCEWCELKPLCRIAERAGWQDDSATEDEQ